MPVLPALEPLFPESGLRRGSVVTVTGSTSLALALVAGASEAGSWCAAAVGGGATSVGLVAAAELGIVLDRFPLVMVPAGRHAEFNWVVAALLDAFEVVVAWPPASLGASVVRRLAARGRDRGSTLVIVGDREHIAGADLQLTVVGASWCGIGRGHGRLESRLLEVRATGRGAAAREHRTRLWLPAPAGGVAPADAGSVRHWQPPRYSMAHSSGTA